ncbi:MAG: 4'-phosphopantetheinyl transferase superfamily protein [Candidatus Levybacteria bacterium]|nr:4'-phosphopantetheinyl transferase superfamily protein [Candidatus Levybacteria bacterium]
MLGIDLVYLPEFETKMKNFPLARIFLSDELSQNKTLESLAGVFAAKEAFFKAIGKKEGWLDVWIEKNKDGKPQLYSTLIKNNEKVEISISHAGDYAVAVVTINN